MHSVRLVAVIFSLLISLFLLVSVYALEESRASKKIYFDHNIKTCVDKETNFFARSGNEEIFESYSVHWDFGEGTSAEGRQVKKVFAQPGVYKVKLVLYDTSLDKVIASDQHRVFVYSPPVAEAGEDQVVCFGESVLFDASHSKTTNFIERCFNCSTLRFIWDFGDGTPVVKKVKARHKYAKPGVYKATLTVIDGKNRRCSVSRDYLFVTVNLKPAIVLREVKLACPGQDIKFSAFLNATKTTYTDRNALSYTWDFADGTIKQGGPDIVHAYEKPGEYLITVTADDGLNNICSKDTQTMKVRLNSPPVADAGPNLVCCVNKKSVFDASNSYDPDGDKLTYAWDFGDGTTAKGVKVTHVYKKLGKYTVVLSVDDNSGIPCSKGFDVFEVNVSEKPVSIIDIYK